jgi:hypothetical protein
MLYELDFEACSYLMNGSSRVNLKTLAKVYLQRFCDQSKVVMTFNGDSSLLSLSRLEVQSNFIRVHLILCYSTPANHFHII